MQKPFRTKSLLISTVFSDVFISVYFKINAKTNLISGCKSAKKFETIYFESSKDGIKEKC